MDRWRRRFWILLAIVVGVPLLIGIVLAMRFLPDRPVTYANIEDHFKYGSTGGERNAGRRRNAVWLGAAKHSGGRRA